MINICTKLTEIIYSKWSPHRKIVHVMIPILKHKYCNTTIIYTRICGLMFTFGVTERMKYVLNINCNNNLSLGRQQPCALYTQTQIRTWQLHRETLMQCSFPFLYVNAISNSNNPVRCNNRKTLVQNLVLWLHSHSHLKTFVALKI